MFPSSLCAERRRETGKDCEERDRFSFFTLMGGGIAFTVSREKHKDRHRLSSEVFGGGTSSSSLSLTVVKEKGMAYEGDQTLPTIFKGRLLLLARVSGRREKGNFKKFKER